MPIATVRLAPTPAAPHDLHAALAEVDRRVGAGVAFNPDPDTQPPPAAIPTGSPPWMRPSASAVFLGGASPRSMAPMAPARPPSSCR
jgi:hypothetical protein